MRRVDGFDALLLGERLRVSSAIAGDEVARVEDLDVVQFWTRREGWSRRSRPIGVAVGVLHSRRLLRWCGGVTGGVDMAAGGGRPRRGGWPEGLVKALLSIGSLDESVRALCFDLFATRR